MYQLYISCVNGAIGRRAAELICRVGITGLYDEVAVIPLPLEEMMALMSDAPTSESLPEALLEAVIGGEMGAVLQTTDVQEISNLLTRLFNERACQRRPSAA
jgi:hypothetical protein